LGGGKKIKGNGRDSATNRILLSGEKHLERFPGGEEKGRPRSSRKARFPAAMDVQERKFGRFSVEGGGKGGRSYTSEGDRLFY